jgi:DNA recombination protein RmuC
VDAKVPLDAYKDALECGDEPRRAECLARYAQQVEKHVKSLAQKKYWDCFDSAPPFVVMFMPLESAFVAALQSNPQLYDAAMRSHVLIATPALLFAYVCTVAHGWQQHALRENAREIARTGAELYERLSKFVETFERIGEGLASSVEHYNASIGSLEGRVLPSARKLKEKRATMDADVEVPDVLDAEVRPIVAAELKPLPEMIGQDRSGTAAEQQSISWPG